MNHSLLDSELFREINTRKPAGQLLDGLAGGVDLPGHAGHWEFEDGVWICSPAFAQLIGLDSAIRRLTHDDFLRCVDEVDRARVTADIERCQNLRTDLLLEFRVVAQGATRWMTSTGSPVTGNGQGNRFRGLAIDTTQLKVLRDAESNRIRQESVERLAGGIAHDFNNLLAGILGGASFLEEVLSESHVGYPILGVIRRSSERAALLTKQLLAYSGKSITTPRKMDLSGTVREACSLAQASMPSNVDVVVQLSTTALPPVEADCNQVRDLVVNLLANAAEALGTNPGTIYVCTGLEKLDEQEIDRSGCERFGLAKVPAPGCYVFLEVRDSGEGMTPEVLRSMFEPFFTTRFTGRGLGLSAVQGIVRAHNGAIEVKSRPNLGSIFRVYLPASESRAVAGEKSRDRQSLARTVLVIDDEEAVRHIALAALERDGCRVLVASDGPTGIDIFRRSCQDISIVLLDVNMPGIHGSKVLEELKRTCPEIPVIITSGYSAGEARSQFPEGSTAGFVQKPFTVRDLASIIEQVAERGAR